MGHSTNDADANILQHSRVGVNRNVFSLVISLLPMTVGTTNVALCNFYQNGVPLVTPTGNHQTDTNFLCTSNVVEVENSKITFTAINTWMRGQIHTQLSLMTHSQSLDVVILPLFIAVSHLWWERPDLNRDCAS
jgi:hypothetical protein